MDFIPGLELNRRFYAEVVRPLLPSGYRHSAALIGPGSDVLGFDTPMSMDHDWGPRIRLFVERPDEANAFFTDGLPRRFLGFQTSFAENEDGTRRLEDGEGRVRHRIEIATLASFLTESLGHDLDADLSAADWLSFPEQRLRSIVGGEVFHDDLGLEAIRSRLRYYPRDVWLYQLASGWERIGQEEHLVGRAGFVGDELGAAVIASRLVRDLMRLTFLIRREYAPYPKWFGTAFARLAGAEELAPKLAGVLRAESWPERDEQLAAAYRVVARWQNDLRLFEPRPTESAPFFGRPFRVLELHSKFAHALRALINDPSVTEIASRPNIGGIDLWSDSTDLISNSRWFPQVRAFYEQG